LQSKKRILQPKIENFCSPQKAFCIPKKKFRCPKKSFLQTTKIILQARMVHAKLAFFSSQKK
jgi:hypothetical protein